MSYPQNVGEFFTNDVSFVRHGGELYDKHLKELRVSFPMLAKFVLQHGIVDAKRDGDRDVARRKRRINVGCCGQAPGTVTVRGRTAPASTFGINVFDKDPVIKKMMANIMDVMTDLEDEIMMDRLGKTRSFYHGPRLDQFGIPLRVGMGATRSRHELYTIQLKCLSWHERAFAHKDDGNCPWFGYTHTGALCGFFFDAKGDLWSLKVLSNSRAKAGSFTSHVFQMGPMIARAKRQTEALDFAYANLVLRQSENGGHAYPNGLTCRTLHNLVLDDSIEWETIDMGPKDKPCGWVCEHFVFPAAPIRHIHLSAPANIVYFLGERTSDVRKQVELGIAAGYHPGYHRFYNLGKKYRDELEECQHPFFKYRELAKRHFGNVPYGDLSSGLTRIVPTKMNSDTYFNDAYLDSDGNPTDVIDCVVTDVIGLLHWINDTVRTDDFNHCNIEKEFKRVLRVWKDKGYDLDIGEFCLMLIIQTLCLAGVVVKGHKDLYNLVYPVHNLGAAKQLGHIGISDRPGMLHYLSAETGHEAFGTDGSEGKLCETAVNRVCRISDYVMKGMMLMSFSTEDGSHIFKEYGSGLWEEFVTFSCGGDES